ncbi:citrate/2-methylcitrate synthase [Salinicoccus sp. Marseille-QA3877]
MDRYKWKTPVSTVQDGEILVRGYAIDEIIERLGFSDAIYLTLKGEIPTEQKSKVFAACLNSILDYSMGPAPFAGRVVASANPQLGPAMAAGILAQGKYAVSPQDAGEFIQEALTELKSNDGDFIATAENIVGTLRVQKKRVPGLGHPSGLGMDPRAAALEKVLEENNLNNDAYQLFKTIQNHWNEVTGKNLVMNVDGMLAVALYEIGLKPVEMGGVAAMSMLPGIIANTVYELENGVPIRQIHDMEYVGEAKREMKVRE